MAQDEKKRAVPVVARGKALERTDEELDALTSAEAMQVLAEGAAEDWRENAPRGFKTLLDSEEEKS